MKDPSTHGSMFVPVILGSDKTTVLVATGHNEYYPLYISNGNVHNNVRRAHCNAISLVSFLAIPKSQCSFICKVLSYLIVEIGLDAANREYHDDGTFRRFHSQLYHALLMRILQSLRPGMITAEVTHCADRHWQHVIYGLGPYIADYPEQVTLACVVQNWCPW